MTGDYIRRWSQALAFAIMLICTPAKAQDLPSEWDGWFGGILLGHAWTDFDFTVNGSPSSDSFGAFTGGLVGGFNAVNGNLLTGFEADITFYDLGGDLSFAKHKVSLVGRLGTFVAPNTLVFGVAGLAGGQYRAKFISTSTTTTTMTVGDDEVMVPVTTTTTLEGEANKRLWGYTLGAGLEQQFDGLFGGMRLGVEYRFTDFQNWDIVFANQVFGIEPQVQEVRGRIIFPF